jgi:hypothetical protein
VADQEDLARRFNQGEKEGAVMRDVAFFCGGAGIGIAFCMAMEALSRWLLRRAIRKYEKDI